MYSIYRTSIIPLEISLGHIQGPNAHVQLSAVTMMTRYAKKWIEAWFIHSVIRPASGTSVRKID